MSETAVSNVSKTKAKCLRAKAKRLRLEAQVVREKQRHETAADKACLWREKASMYKRKIQVVEMKKVLSWWDKLPQRRTSILSSATMVTTNRSCVRATPSTLIATSNIIGVPMISSKLLSAVDQPSSSFGSGCFGCCYQMVYKDMFSVCAKVFPSNISCEVIKVEAAILISINSEYVPHCFGVCEEKRAIVMSHITLSGRSFNLHTFLNNPPEDITCTSTVFFQLLLDICNGIHFIHSVGILHNDLKLDNVVLGNSTTRKLKAYIVDFGKACSIGNGKTYRLTPEQIALYKKEHTQIAPDLRDGKTAQSEATDVYSLGRIIRKVNQVLIHSSNLSALAREATQYSSSKRPTIIEIIHQLSH